MSITSGLLTAGAQQIVSSMLVKPRRSVGAMVLQVTLSESHQDELEITDHPIEQGALISDHAFKRPAEVTIQGAWSLSPSQSGLIDGVLGGLKSTITGAQQILSGKAPDGLSDIYNRLLKLQKEVIPFDVYTGKRKYSNMVIRSLSVTTDTNSENSLMVTLVCREVLMVATRILSVTTDTSKMAAPAANAAPTPSGVRSLQPSSVTPAASR